MTTKPKLKIFYTKLDWRLQILTPLILCGMWIYIGIYYNSLPDQIPVCFEIAENTNAFSYEIGIFLLDIVTTMIHTLLWVLQKFPHPFNYAAKTHPKNS